MATYPMPRMWVYDAATGMNVPDKSEWRILYAPISRKAYYWNTITDETTWIYVSRHEVERHTRDVLKELVSSDMFCVRKNRSE